MAQWGNQDASSNAVLWAPTSVKLAPNTDNRDALFGNTTADAFVTNETVGMFAVDTNEITAEGGKTAHTGWVLRREGTGGRAGRVQTEVLVAGGIGNDAEDTKYPDYVIRITSQPVSANVYSGNNQTATFTVVGATTPAGGSISYQWQRYITGNTTWINVTNSGAYANATTASLKVSANTGIDGEKFRVRLSVTGADTVTSSNATIVIL